VKDAYTSYNNYGGGDPAQFAPAVYMTGVQDGDQIVINATVTDPGGTSITSSFLLSVAYPPDQGAVRVRPDSMVQPSAAKRPPQHDKNLLGSGKPDLSTVRPSPHEHDPIPPLPPLGNP